MSVNKNKWQAIAEKYDSKAKWADALLMLNLEDHDDLLSALVELSPEDLAREEMDSEYVVNSTWVNNLDTSKITVDRRAEEALEKARQALDAVDKVDMQTSQVLVELANLQAKLEDTEKADDKSFLNLILNFDGSSLPDPEEVANAIKRELGRDRPSK